MRSAPLARKSAQGLTLTPTLPRALTPNHQPLAPKTYPYPYPYTCPPNLNPILNPNPNQERKAVQFYGLAAPRAGTCAVHEFWNERLRQLTVHAGEPWPGEQRGQRLFHAYPNW